MTKNVPRYVLDPSTDGSVEIAVVNELTGHPVATLVAAGRWVDALTRALRWSQEYTRKFDEKNRPTHATNFYPQVRYGTGDNVQRRLVKRIDGSMVWAEQRNGGMGCWLIAPVVRP